MKNREAVKGKKTKAKPAVLLLLTVGLCALLIYLWNTYYTPNLPKTEIPPFLAESREDGSAVTYRRREGVYNFLLLGVDAVSQSTDVMMLLSFDTKEHVASIVQIPRDTYIDGYKINTLLARYTSRAKNDGNEAPEDAGLSFLCDTLEKTLCVQIDHTVLCSLSALRDTVDILGGVTLTVPCDMDYDDPSQKLSIHLKAGTQTLTGDEAEQFVRFRARYVRGDLGRVDMQKLFLSALLEQVKGISLSALPALVTTATEALTVSLSPSELLYFIKEARSLMPQNVTFVTLPGTDCRANGTSGAWYYVSSRQGAWECVNAYLNVYETAVGDRIFDRGYRLTNQNKSAMLTYYKTYVPMAEITSETMLESGVAVLVY